MKQEVSDVVRLLDYLLGVVSLLALPFIAWWGIYQSPQSAAALEAKLETAANAALSRAGIDWAQVSMEGQKAVLRGAAPSEDAVDEAAQIVLRSSGPGGILAGGVSQVENRVTAAEPVRPYVWSVTRTDGGGLTISGHVPSRAVREALMLEAQASARGPVEDRMVLAPGAPGGNWQGIARFAIEQVALLDTGGAVLSDTSLTIKGDVADDEIRSRMTAAVSGVAAPFRGAALIRGIPLWAASVSGSTLVLSGVVSTDAERRSLLALARQSFDGDVRDEMTIAASPAAGWIEGARAGLPHFAGFTNGTMAFDPVINGFTFEGMAAPSTLFFLNEDMVRHAGRWRFVIAAEPLPAPEADVAEDACEADMNAALASPEMKFEKAGARIDPSSAATLDRLAYAAVRCGPRAELELEAGEGPLDEARAEQIAEFLSRSGLARPRLAAIGYGPVPAGEGMDTGADTASVQPLKITVREQNGQ